MGGTARNGIGNGIDDARAQTYGRGTIERAGVCQTPETETVIHAADLKNGFGTEEVLRTTMAAFKLISAGNRRPDGETGRSVQLHAQGWIRGIKLDDVDGGRACGQLSFRKGINLRAAEAGGNKVEFIGGDVEAVGVGADVRVVAKAGPVSRVSAKRAMVVRSSLGAIVLDRKAVDIPSAARIRSYANGEIEMIAAGMMA